MSHPRRPDTLMILSCGKKFNEITTDFNLHQLILQQIYHTHI